MVKSPTAIRSLPACWDFRSHRSKLPSPQYCLIQLIVEADQHCVAGSACRRAQIARRAEHVFEQFGLCWGIALHVKFDDGAALGADDARSTAGQFDCVGLRQFRLTRIDLLFDLRFVLRKEPLRFAARRSPVAMIIPVDSSSHCSALSIGWVLDAQAILQKPERIGAGDSQTEQA